MIAAPRWVGRLVAAVFWGGVRAFPRRSGDGAGTGEVVTACWKLALSSPEKRAVELDGRYPCSGLNIIAGPTRRFGVAPQPSAARVRRQP